MYAITKNDGMYVSNDHGRVFQSVSTPFHGSISIATDASGKYVYVISVNATVFRSTDSGSSWMEIDMTSISDHQKHQLTSISVSSGGLRVFITNSRDSIFKSGDYGDNWEVSFNDRMESDVKYSFISSASSSSGEMVFAITQMSKGMIIKSENNGTSYSEWKEFPFLLQGESTDIACSSSGKNVYVTTGNVDGFIYQSNSGGTQWREVDGGNVLPRQRYSAITTSKNGALVFATASNGIYVGSYGSDDATFVRTNSPELAWTSVATAKSNPEFLVAVGYSTKSSTEKNQGVWISTDYGDNFLQVYESDMLLRAVAISANGKDRAKNHSLEFDFTHISYTPIS